MCEEFMFPVSDSDFKKSSWSDFPRKVCVQIAMRPEGVAIRDSKDRNQKTLYFTHEEFEAFKKGVVAGEFDGAA